MKASPEHNERMAKMTFASVYPHYVAKVERKGKTVNELHQIIEWLTGFNEIENPLTKQVRYLDKLVDELANGRKMEKYWK